MRLLTIDHHAPMVVGLNSRFEFWVCVAPTVIGGLYGIVSRDLAVVLYAALWFIAAYVFFIVYEHLRKRLIDDDH